MIKRKATRLLLILILLLVAASLSLRWALSSERLRRNWVRGTVPQIAQQAADQMWIDRTSAALMQKMALPSHENGDWVGEQMAIMRNGERIIYRNECVHRHQILGDIFVGKASNGRPYYSSYHFCCEMVVPKMEDQPADLASFVQKYYLREFDGKSDEAIKLTWTPGSAPIH